MITKPIFIEVTNPNNRIVLVNASNIDTIDVDKNDNAILFFEYGGNGLITNHTAESIMDKIDKAVGENSGNNIDNATKAGSYVHRCTECWKEILSMSKILPSSDCPSCDTYTSWECLNPESVLKDNC